MRPNLIRLTVVLIAFGFAVVLPVILWTEWTPLTPPVEQSAETRSEPARNQRARDATRTRGMETRTDETPRQRNR